MSEIEKAIKMSEIEKIKGKSSTTLIGFTFNYDKGVLIAADSRLTAPSDSDDDSDEDVEPIVVTDFCYDKIQPVILGRVYAAITGDVSYNFC